MLVPRVWLLVSCVTVVVSASWVNIAHIAAKDGYPLGLMVIPPVLDRQSAVETVYDVTMTNLARGYHGTLSDINDGGGIPVAESSNETVFLNEMWFNVGVDPKTQSSNETYWATKIASGAYGVIPVVMVHYTLTAYRSACESTQNCIAISAVLPNIAEYQCVTPLPADCVANHLAVGARRGKRVFSGLQDANTLGDEFFYAMAAHGQTNVALIGGSSLTPTLQAAMLRQAQAAGLTCSFSQSWIPADPTINAATYTSPDAIRALVKGMPVQPPIQQTLLFVASAAEVGVVTTFMQIFLELNLNFYAIAVVNGAHAVMVPPWSDYIYATVPWVDGIQGLNYDSTSFPGYHVYPTNGTMQMPKVYAHAIAKRWPTMPPAYYPISVIASGTTQLVAHAIAAAGRLNPIVEDIRVAMGVVYRPSPNGLLQIDGHLGRVVNNQRVLLQMQPPVDGVVEYRYQSPNSLKKLPDVIPAPTYDERQPTVKASFDLVYLPLPVFITVFGAWAAIILQENIHEAAYPIRLSPTVQTNDSLFDDKPIYSLKLWMWMVFATLAISLSFWSALTLAVISIQFTNLFPGHTLITYGTPLIANWLLSAVSTFLSLLVMLHTVVKNRKSNGDLDTELKAAHSASSPEGGPSRNSIKSVTASNVRTGIRPATQPAQAGQTGQQTVVGAAYVFEKDGVHVRSRWKLLSEYPTFDLRHVGASLVMAVGMFGVFYLSWSGIHGYVVGSFSSGVSVMGLVLLVWILVYCSFYALFHIRVHWLRYSALVTLPLAMLVSGYGLASLARYRQIDTTSWSSSDYTVTDMLLWAVPPTAVILVLLVSAVILSLNASRRLLYGVVLKDRRQNAKEIADLTGVLHRRKFSEDLAKLHSTAISLYDIELGIEHPVFKRIWEQVLRRPTLTKAQEHLRSQSLAILPGLSASASAASDAAGLPGWSDVSAATAAAVDEYEPVLPATLEQLIDNDLTYYVMKEMARKRECVELISCCKHVVLYRKLKTAVERAAHLKFIHDVYLIDGEKYTANINVQLRSALRNKFFKQQFDPPLDFLDEMKREMLNLARDNILHQSIRDVRPDVFTFINRWIHAVNQIVKRFDQTNHQTDRPVALSQVAFFDQPPLDQPPPKNNEAGVLNDTSSRRPATSLFHTAIELGPSEQKAKLMGCGVSRLAVDSTVGGQQLAFDEALRADALKKSSNMEAVLFGTGESGKTTLSMLFEMYIQPSAVQDVYGCNGLPTPLSVRYQVKDDADVKRLLFENVVSCLQQLLKTAGDKQLMSIEQVETDIDALGKFLDVGAWSKCFVDKCEELWKSPHIQTVVSNRHPFGYWILENCPYYMEHLRRFALPDSGITFEDKLRSRKRTTIISTTKPLNAVMTEKNKLMWRVHAETKHREFKRADNLNYKTGALPLAETDVLVESIQKAPHTIGFSLIDIGGQKTERQKWARYFTNVSAVIYLVNLNGFGQWMFEEKAKDQMVDSWEQLQTLTKERDLLNNRFILVFTKTDLFRQQLEQFKSPENKLKITDFPFMADYKHGNDVSPVTVLNYIKEKFLALLRPSQRATSYSVCTIEPTQVFEMFRDLHQDLVLHGLPSMVDTIQKHSS